MVLEEKYQFIHENIYLIAQVDENTGRQQLIIQKLSKNGKHVELQDRITCIHTAVLNLNYREFLEMNNNPQAKKKLLEKINKVRSSERLKHINLSIDMKFLAFKSWVQGIAEAGIDAFKIQDSIEEYTKLMNPISNRLLQFMVRVDPNFIEFFLRKIEKECSFNGKLHIPSFISNIHILEDYFSRNPSQKEKYIPYIMDLCPEYLYLVQNVRLRREFAENVEYISNKSYKKLYSDDNWYVRRSVVSNKAAAKLYPKLHKTLFPEKMGYKKIHVIEDPKSIQFEEFKFLFRDDDENILAKLSENEQLPKLFPIKFCYLFKNDSKIVKKALAGNKEAVQFEQYKRLFQDQNWEVRRAIHSNIYSQKYYPHLFDKLIPNKYGKTKKEMILNKNSPKYEEYSKFFEDSDWKIKMLIASNKNAVKYKDFPKLFNEIDRRILNALVRNPNVPEIHKEYQLFFKSNDPNIKRGLVENPSARKYAKYRKLFYDSDLYIRKKLAEKKFAVQYEEYESFFIDKNWIVRKAVAENFEATKLERYKNLFLDSNIQVKLGIASNPSAVQFEKEFKKMFNENNITILQKIALNPNATELKLFNTLFEKKDLILLRNLARNKKAALLGKYISLFQIPDKQIKINIAKNENAINFDEYNSLFHEFDIDIIKGILNNQKALEKYPDQLKEFNLFQGDVKIRKIASDPEMTRYNGYKLLFKLQNIQVIKEIAKNEKATRFKDFQDLFYHPDFYVRRLVVQNKSAKERYPQDFQTLIPIECGLSLPKVIENEDATNFEEYKLFFKKKYEKYWHLLVFNPGIYKFKEIQGILNSKDSRLRYRLTDNPNFHKIDNFENYFSDDKFIRRSLASNEQLINNEEYLLLFNDNEESVRSAVAWNKEAVKLNEYVKFFTDTAESVRRNAAGNPNAVRFEEFINFFTDPSVSVRVSVARNPKAVVFQEYTQLFNDKSESVRSALAQNSEAVKFVDYQILFNDPSWNVRRNIVYNKEASEQYPENFKTLIPSKYRGYRINDIAKRVEATNHPEFKFLFSEENLWIKRDLARNPGAVNFEEYLQLFRDSDWYVRRAIVGNEKAKECFPKEYPKLFPSELGRTPEEVLVNPLAVKYDEFQFVLNSKESTHIELAKQNPNYHK